MASAALKKEARRLRLQGKTYGEISKALGVAVPKSSMSYWFRALTLSSDANRRLLERRRSLLAEARTASISAKSREREDRCRSFIIMNHALISAMKRRDVAKIALTMLFLGEGSKNPKRASLVFGNSDPGIIRTFLRLLRRCYVLNEDKLRCTVQCRADQDCAELERFWSGVTGIPRTRFYGSRIDARTFGRPTRKTDYKGVCRIDYFSSFVFNELLQVSKMITVGP